MRGEQGDRLPRWLRATLGTLGDVVLFAALSLVIWTILPAVALGATPVIIGGGSMSPLIRAGDVILLDETPPPAGEMFAPGTVITFEQPGRTSPQAPASDPALAAASDATAEPTGSGQLVTHRVASIADGHYVTRGDANAGNDPRPVNPDQLVGVGRWLVPAIGLPAHWARTGAWHLVALTVLTSAAAVAASLAGRPRVAVEVPDEAVEDLPVELPEVAPDEQAVPEPAVAAPVLAFHLEPELELEPPLRTDLEPVAASDDADPVRELPAAAEVGPNDDATLDPAAAERAATIAAQAARRSMAGLDRLREEQDEQEEAVNRPRRGDQHDSAGSAPVASVLAIAIALIASTVAPSFAAAAYVATTSNPGNTFTVAEPDETSEIDVVVDLNDDWGTGYCADVIVSTTSTTPLVWSFELDLSQAPTLGGTPNDTWDFAASYEAPILSGQGLSYNETVVAGSPRTVGFCAARSSVSLTSVIPAPGGSAVLEPPNNTETPYSWSIAPDEPTAVVGPIQASVELRRSSTPGGNVTRYVWLQVVIDGSVVSQNQVFWNGSSPTNPEWQTFDVTLWQHLPSQVIGPDTDIEFRIVAYRLDVRVNGATAVTLPAYQ